MFIEDFIVMTFLMFLVRIILINTYKQDNDLTLCQLGHPTFFFIYKLNICLFNLALIVGPFVVHMKIT